MITSTATFSACALFHGTHEQSKSMSIHDRLAELETSSGGRIGVFAIDTKNNSRIQYRADERFPMCSTSKAMVVAAILKKNMTTHGLLNQRIIYDKKEVAESGYAPITEKHIDDGMTISELCASTLQHSDNTAANLLMKKLGGPTQVTTFAHSIGDHQFRLDRWEPELNSAIPGDEKDTTTPAAMGVSLEKLVIGNALGQTQRKQLEDWLKGNTTGGARIRAGVPQGWVVGDKTGTCSYGTTNDIGIIWSPNGTPIVVVIYFTQKNENSAPHNDVIASVTRFLVDEIQK